MGLKEPDMGKLSEKEDYKFRCFYGRTPVFNDISYTRNSEKLKVETFRFSHDSIFSLKTDDEEIPFARVKQVKRLVLPDKYLVRVEISKNMIPRALEALALYMQTDPFIANDSFSKGEVMPHIKEVEAIQKELYNELKSGILENKPKEPYMKRALKKRGFKIEIIPSD